MRLIDADALMEHVYRDRLDSRELIAEMVRNAPTIEPTLYGYNIKHLSYIARAMQKEGVTAEYAVRTFGDVSRASRMIIEELQEKVEKSLSAMQLPSAEPEIIRCKDCKHHHRDNSGAYYCGRKDYGYGWGLNDFCSDAERMED